MLFTTAAAQSAMPAAERGEKVTLIIEVEGAPLLEMKNAIALGAAEFMGTTEAKTVESHILSSHAEVKSNIKKGVQADTDTGFTYTSVFNGFSIDAYTSDIDRIKAIDGVKNVYISQTHAIPDNDIAPTSETAGPEVGADMMNARYMYDLGYDGRHQAVAILDSEFDVGHEFFESEVIDPKFTKDDAKRFLEVTEINANISANQIYRSSKIPFAYDYGEENADTYSTAYIHGTHVAGIAAGKNGHHHNMLFSGTAPEAQLLLMKISDANGNLPDDVALAAFDDVSKMGVCAVNYSISAPVITWCMDSVMENLRNAGIIVMTCAGNNGRAQETTDNPDYAYPSNPSLLSSTTSVASINADRVWVTENKMILSSGDVVTYNLDDDTGFFEKLSDRIYEYVILSSASEIDSSLLYGKVAVLPYDLYSNRLLPSFYKAGAEAVIITLDTEDDEEGTIYGNMPVIFVRTRSSQKLYAATVRGLRTFNMPDYYQLSRFPEISYYTSWGTNTMLELNPDITAPGANILSSVPDDEYENMSGTSMAAPHMTGAAALMSGFMEDKFPAVTGADKVALMENLLMSSAKIIFRDEENTLPESPRRQGAGLADLEAAAKIPVILKGDTGKSKLSLGDMLEDEITLTFTAKNLTNKNVTYNDVTLYMFTDNYEVKEDANYISDSVALNFTSDAKGSYTIPANRELEITINISLDKAQTAENLKVFTNGFYVDGFVVLSNSETKSSMPFTGFYGDWTAFDAMTPTYFEDGGSAKFGGLMSDSGEILGRNQILNKLIESGAVSEKDYIISEYESEDYVGYSPDGDGIWDWMNVGLYMRRSLIDAYATIYDSNGYEFWWIEFDYDICRHKDGIYAEYSLDYLPDGDYTMLISGWLAYDSDRSRMEEKTLKFYVDTVAPEIAEPHVYDKGKKTYAEFTAKDNRYLMGVIVYENEEEVALIPIKPSGEADIVIDITGYDKDDLSFAVIDYAYNITRFTIDVISAELVADPIMIGNSLTLALGISNTGVTVDADIIAAAYSADGTLLNTSIYNQVLDSGQQMIKSVDLVGVANAAYAKVFIWTHDEVTPLSEVLEIALF